MDYLVEHGANLDCASKSVTLISDENIEIFMICESQDYVFIVISTFVVEKLVQKGCEAYMAFVSDSGIVKLSGLFRCFPVELLGINPDKEVEFGIELLPRNALVPIAPYRMAPKELMELKPHL
ncbi:alcohol-forming fatty acyl-CoA reductase-like [Gossypium australe]|uniref:Alcohol-forming fatty acyl-CoA reductase-like n=1 Tax=Gossypium australe TaxID=47621 RepID=A0A5B6X187_9ROSI|nr:alcohol-forming fatty acyl-CoA reductase-like [Gossypium australe]